MKYLGIALIYVSFFALIGLSIYWSDSLLPLWALLLTPEYSSESNSDNEGDE